MTTFDDENAKKLARQHYLAGIASLGLKAFDLTAAHKNFEEHWRFLHCTKCGQRIRDKEDIGNVDISFRDVGEAERTPVADHKVCP